MRYAWHVIFLKMMVPQFFWNTAESYSKLHLTDRDKGQKNTIGTTFFIVCIQKQLDEEKHI